MMKAACTWTISAVLFRSRLSRSAQDFGPKLLAKIDAA